MYLNDDERKKIALLLNTRFDIPLVPEKMEASIFESAVGVIDNALEGVLPDAFSVLLREDNTGIDPALAQEFGDRLAVALNKKVDLPYFNEEQEAGFIKSALEPLVEAMTDGEKLDVVLNRVKARVGDRIDTVTGENAAQ
ncbi:MAG: hypothetical protein AAF485_21960 [Chloroflexota bacterium]